jgi:hypothetical protein
MSLRTLLLLTLITLAGCALPRTSIKQTFERRGILEAGGRRVQTYRARDFRTLDSSAKILRVEYLPVMMYAVLDERDSVDLLVVAAWQELLWRFSEKLSPTDKSYYTPIPLHIARGGDTAVVTWGYPSLDTRDDDLRSITPYRNSYWSVDLYDGALREELFRGDLQSHPQYAPYDVLKRFAPGGTYERALADTVASFRALDTYLRTMFARDGADTTRRR